LSNSSNIKQI